MKCIRKGFTLVELMVVLSIIALLIAIMMPALGKVRRHTRSVVGITNQRHIVGGVTNFASDHNDRYPESVATIGVEGGWWNWEEPMVLTGYRARSPRLHRSMSAYLHGYIKDATIIFCPSAPIVYKYLHESWEQGDDWDNPETPPVQDPVKGTYCFYWNYLGVLEGRRTIFKGPRNLIGGRRYSTLLVSDYFGYDHWRSPNAYGSCEKFHATDVTPGTPVSSAYWSRLKSRGNINLNTIEIQLHAGYTDGHVESYSASEVITMKVSITADGSMPYPSGVGPGDFYLPLNGVQGKF